MARNRDWLLDVVALAPRRAAIVLARVGKPGGMNVHPVAARQADGAMLRKMAGAGDAA